jgi:beta-lactamase regulating signal transducer with metallopeptidase domain
MTEISRLAATYLINSIWQVPIVAVVAWLCLKPLRRVPVNYQHWVWVTTLLLGTAIPLATLRGANSLEIPLSPSALNAPTLSEASGSPPLRSVARPFLHRIGGHHRTLLLPPFVTMPLGILYLAFVSWRFGRLGWALRCGLQLRAGACRVPHGSLVERLVERSAFRLGLKKIPILCSSLIAGPLTLGIRESLIIFPEKMLAEASETDLHSALCHEMAHIRRKDFLLNLIYEVLCLPISFHPVARLIKSRIDQTREIACDEVASAQASSRVGYASSLLSIAQSIGSAISKTDSIQALSLFDSNGLEERIVNLLTDAVRMSRRMGRVVATAIALVLTIGCFGVSSYSFQVAQNQGQKFAGTWKAEHDGKTILLLEFHTEQGKLTGTIRAMDFEMDLEGTGEVKQLRGGPLSEPMTLTNLKMDGEHLFFDFKEDDDPDSTHWRMDLTHASRADLEWIELPPGFKAKPFHLIKKSAN